MGKKKRLKGSDIVELDTDEISEYLADSILEYNTCLLGEKYPILPNFEKRYRLADFCLNFGVVKVEKVKI